MAIHKTNASRWSRLPSVDKTDITVVYVCQCLINNDRLVERLLGAPGIPHRDQRLGIDLPTRDISSNYFIILSIFHIHGPST